MTQRVPIFGALKDRGLLQFDGEKWILRGTEVNKERINTNWFAEAEKNGIGPGTFVAGEKKGWIQCNKPVNSKKPYYLAYLQPKEIVYTCDHPKSLKVGKLTKN